MLLSSKPLATLCRGDRSRERMFRCRGDIQSSHERIPCLLKGYRSVLKISQNLGCFRATTIVKRPLISEKRQIQLPIFLERFSLKKYEEDGVSIEPIRGSIKDNRPLLENDLCCMCKSKFGVKNTMLCFGVRISRLIGSNYRMPNKFYINVDVYMNDSLQMCRINKRIECGSKTGIAWVMLT